MPASGAAYFLVKAQGSRFPAGFKGCPDIFPDMVLIKPSPGTRAYQIITKNPGLTRQRKQIRDFVPDEIPTAAIEAVYYEFYMLPKSNRSAQLFVMAFRSPEALEAALPGIRRCFNAFLLRKDRYLIYAGSDYKAEKGLKRVEDCFTARGATVCVPVEAPLSAVKIRRRTFSHRIVAMAFQQELKLSSKVRKTPPPGQVVLSNAKR